MTAQTFKFETILSPSILDHFSPLWVEQAHIPTIFLGPNGLVSKIKIHFAPGRNIFKFRYFANISPVAL
jgi:hypothetical protein